MIPGRTLAAGEEVYTEWFPRGGDNIIMRAQAIDRSGSTLGCDIILFTKNEETTGDGTAVQEAGTSDPIKLSLGTTSTDVEGLVFQSAATGPGANKGLLQLVRYKISVTGGSAGDGKWLTVRLFPPVFFDAGK